MKQLVMMKGAALLACVLMLGSCINERKVLGVFDSEVYLIQRRLLSVEPMMVLRELRSSVLLRSIILRQILSPSVSRARRALWKTLSPRLTAAH